MFYFWRKKSIPTSKCAVKMIKDLKGKLESGEIHEGENVVPRRYTVVKLKNSFLIVEEKTVQSRKIPLERMRKRLLKHHKDRGL